MNMWNSVTWLLLGGLAASTSATCAAAEARPAQPAPVDAAALPWGPPVPRALQGSAQAHRQRVLAHCVRARQRQSEAEDDATHACLLSLPSPPMRPASRWASRPMPDGTRYAQ